MTARSDLYAALMGGGYHTPDRSNRATARIDAYRAQVLRDAADMVDAGGPGCQCGSCEVSRQNAAALRHEADLVEGITISNGTQPPAPAAYADTRGEPGEGQ